MTQHRRLENVPLAITVVLHIVILVAFIWFGQDIKPLPVPKHIQAVIVPPPSPQSASEASSSAAKQALPPKEKPQEPQINKRAKAERQAAEVAVAATQKAEALAEAQKVQALTEAKQQKRELAKAQAESEKQQAIKEAAVKEEALKQQQVETEQKYALKKEQHAQKLKAEKLKTELDAKRAKELEAKNAKELDAKHAKETAEKEAKIADEKAKARLQEKKTAEEAKKLAAKEATDNAKTVKERAIKDAKLAQEKADKEAKAKAVKEQAANDAKAAKALKEQAANDAKAAKAAQEKADKLAAAKASADAKRRLSQSLGNDDAEFGKLKSQVAANAKANSVGKFGAQIKSHIKNAWHVPIGSSGLTATARFTLSSNGSVSSVVITHSSGNDDFDASVKALRNLNGVPVPDDSDTFSQVNTPSITFKAP